MPSSTTTPQQSPSALGQFDQGIQCVDDYQKYLSLLKHTDDFKANVFDPLNKTVDRVLLKRFVLPQRCCHKHCIHTISCSIGESQEFGKVMKQIVDIACSSWDEDLIRALLKVCLNEQCGARLLNPCVILDYGLCTTRFGCFD